MWRPRFRSDYVPVRLPDGPLVVLGETRSLLVDDPVAADLADLLDGVAPLADVLARLAGRHPVAAVAAALARLRDHGLLVSGPAGTSSAEAAGWDARGVPPDAAGRWLARGAVTVVDLGAPRATETADALRSLGLAVTVVGPEDPEPGPPGAPVLVLPSSMLDPRLAALNARHLAAGRAWTLARPHGNVLLLGPHLVPGRTGCWACLRQRWQENEQVNAFLGGQELAGPVPRPDRAVLPGLATAVAGLLAAELAVLAVRGESPRLTGRLVALDTRDLSLETHHLVRQPQCPACGDPDLVGKADPRIELPPSGAQPSRAGDSRTREPAEVYASLAHHVSRYLGVVSRLTPLEATDNGVTHTYSAGHNFAQPRQLAGLRRNLRGQSGGKGRTDLQARMSAIGEAVERYCGVWRGDRPVHRATYRQLGPERAVHLRDLLLFSDRQYAERDRLNADLGHLHRVPRPLADDVELDWTTGWSLTRGTARELPAAHCWYGHPELTTLAVCSADSNGCAAGGTVAEAILQGFCELVERDSVALWWYHRSRLPGVDLASFADPWLAACVDHHATALGRELWALDLTADLDVPAFAAVSRRTGGAAEDVLVGFGAHLDARVALTRALTEVNQFLPAVPGPTSGRNRYGIDDPDSARWFGTVRVAEQPWLTPDPTRPPRTRADHRSASTGDVGDDVRECVRRAERAGLEVIVVDQSRPDIDLAVVKVVVPGLRHFWRRLGPGRLWEVPARLGRGPLAADEASANPLNVFF
ncbi:TOMM precursor leader peptide-binding protein [Micromonospora auratinigra]|uniref:Ribosomal protein S12 methylthiotransferase accessory factor n=1 Tax=Micromonospora auratinigra TaxID=261654 RepID=A0A1A8ZFQ3_9ACTN|nr:TOMM precursor leader peptide-binding protein [Micromonospora auratinigra]SBT42638.1 ribosomal protein S12 methylthiotransferase accessory factor [Micromonospora auratinigra]